MSEYQEEVITNLLDLQAELRGDEPGPHGDPADTSPKADDADGRESLVVTEEGVSVSMSSHTSTGTGVNERLAALNERLAQLEYELLRVTKRLERMEPDLEVVRSGSTDAGVDERWHSFIDLQKIVADRLDRTDA
jgi:hypothetical protein